MPLFGKKKENDKAAEAKKAAQASAPYPRQGAAGSSYGVAPPAYGAAGGYPQQPPQHMQNAPPPYSAMPQAGGYPAQYQQGPTTVVVPTAFDAGARFNHGARPTIPPPPPGMMPNAAQMAIARGQNVVAGQRQETFMGGTGDGGYVIW